MTRAQHYPECDKPGMPADRCKVCSYIEAGHQAARDAVAAIPEGCNCYEDTGIRDAALAAIDALGGSHD